VISDQYVVLHQICGDLEFYKVPFTENFLVNMVGMLVSCGCLTCNMLLKFKILKS